MPEIRDPELLALLSGGGKTGSTKSQTTPAIRRDALNSYNMARDLGPMIDEIENTFQAGPGSTSGLRGLMDYLPLPQNERFNKSADKMRSFVKEAQGFTGGEGNTIGEMKMNIGAFIPNASDYDSTSRDNIAMLRRLQKRQLETAIQTLGGVPDANGNITPVTPAAPKSKRMIGGRGAPAPARGRVIDFYDLP